MTHLFSAHEVRNGGSLGTKTVKFIRKVDICGLTCFQMKHRQLRKLRFKPKRIMSQARKVN
jgi:hypothetical protein